MIEIAFYIFAYLCAGALAVRIWDRIMGFESPAELAAFVFFSWPVFGLVGMMMLVIWIFVPDIFKRETAPFLYGRYIPPAPPPPPPPTHGNEARRKKL